MQLVQKDPLLYCGLKPCNDRLQILFNKSQQFFIGICCWNFGEFCLECFGGAEQRARLALLNHANVVVAIAACNGFEIERLKRLYGLVFLIVGAQFVAGNFAIFSNLKGVAENGWITEFLH